MSLYEHTAHPHTPRNPNDVHAAERAQHAAKSRLHAFNETLAVWLTAYVGTMWTAYGFAAVAVVGLFGVLAILSPNIYTLIAWLSQTFIQLVLLPVIMVGQNVLNRHSELMAEEMYHGVVRLLHEQAEAAKHLGAQDAELLKQTGYLVQLVSGKPAQPLLAVSATVPTVPTSAKVPAKPARPARKPAKRGA